MKRADLEHILRPSKRATGETEFIVIGSQAILGKHPDAPRVLRQSMEADEALIASAANDALRERLGEAWAICRARAAEDRGAA